MTYVDFSRLKREIPIERVLAHYGLTEGMRRHGADLRGPCPVHQGSNPTQFSVHPEKNCWRCFTCDAGGSVLDLVAALEGVVLREAALRMLGWFGVDGGRAAVAGPRPAPPARRRPPPPARNVPLRFRLALDPSHPYLAARGLAPETVEVFGLGYCAQGILAGRIAIPIHDAAGRLVAYAGRWPGAPPPGVPKYLLPPSFAKSLELFNLHRALRFAPESASGPLIVVEGFFGCMALWQAGYPRTVGLMGSTLSDAQSARILAASGQFGRVLLFLDEDEAGRKGRSEALRRLSPGAYVRALELPLSGADPESFSPSEIRRLIDGSGCPRLAAATPDPGARHPEAHA